MRITTSLSKWLYKRIFPKPPKPERNHHKHRTPEYIPKDVINSFNDEFHPKPRKLNKKYGCQICEYIYISSKNTCGHKFCEDCIMSVIIPNNALNNCVKCEEFIAKSHQVHLKV